LSSKYAGGPCQVLQQVLIKDGARPKLWVTSLYLVETWIQALNATDQDDLFTQSFGYYLAVQL